MKKKYLIPGVLLLLICLLLIPSRAEAAQSGLVKKNGYLYFYNSSGTKVRSRLRTIGNATYYFNKKGRALKNTMKVIRGNRYYFRSSGKAATGWLTLDGEKYYFDEDGVGATGLTTIGKSKYYFADDGTMQTGWQYFEDKGKKAYFYLKTGKMAVNRTIDGSAINSKGYATMTHADKSMISAEAKAAEILESITNDSMSKSEKLRAAFNYMSSSSRFSYVTWRAFSVYDGWEYDYALEIYNKRGGNCYNFACGFAVLAKVIGYEPYVIRGRVTGTRDGAADGLTRHAYVRIDGLYYDPEAQCAGWATGIYASSVYPVAGQVIGSSKI